jgi:hypothetical protein
MKVNTDNIEAVLCADAAVDLNRLWRPFMDKKTGEVDLLEWAWSITHRVANPDEGDLWIFAACAEWTSARRDMVLRLADVLVERAKYRVRHYIPRYVVDLQESEAMDVISKLEHYRKTLIRLKDGGEAARLLISMRRTARTLAADLNREGETYMQQSDLCIAVGYTST